jgi:hypothetical protein
VLHARVARAAEPAVGLADEPEAAVAVGVALGDRGAAVGRAVVDEDRLEVVDARAGQRVEAVRQVPLDLVDRHDDAQPGHAGIVLRGRAELVGKL